jgi:hypothetical protein
MPDFFPPEAPLEVFDVVGTKYSSEGLKGVSKEAMMPTDRV